MTEYTSVHSVGPATPLLNVESVNLVAGSNFVVCSRDGWVHPGGLQGYYSGDSRVLAVLRLTVDGLVPLAVQEHVTEQSISVNSVVGDPSRPSLLVRHSLMLSEVLRLSVAVENLGSEPVHPRVDLLIAADFADIFDVKRGDRPREGFVGSGPSEGDLVLSFESGDFRRGLRVRGDRELHVLRDGVEVQFSIGPHAREEIGITLIPEAARYEPINQTPVDLSCPCVIVPEHLGANNPRLRRILERSAQDIDSLRMHDPLQPEHPVIAAGSPWFLALFGRDALITAWQILDIDDLLALNVLEALARRQGRRVVPETDEEPGRVLHEVRSGEAVRKPTGWGSIYYGSVDSTPLFIALLGAAFRRGVDRNRVQALMEAAERALLWVDQYGDRDGDGLIEFPGRARGLGLDNQAWKDSADAVRHRDGSLAQGPIAMVEVQGYLHRALIDLAELREAFDIGDGDQLRKRAARLQEQIHEQFWMESEDCFALALDGAKRQVGSVATNAGHLLWTGTAYPEVADRMAVRLLQPDLFSGFGLRTLSSANPGYNPMSYHCGSVWPHDSALVAQGLFAYGCTEAAVRIGLGLIDAADEHTGRLPELFGGFDRSEHPRPVPYPASCSPQAWAAAAPLLLARFLP